MIFPKKDDVEAFVFKRCFFDEKTTTAHLIYAFDDGPELEERIFYPDVPPIDAAKREAIDACLRLLHLAAGVSYYKAYIPEKIKIESTVLSKEEAGFFKMFYESGLGEFSYRNKVDPILSFPFGDKRIATPAIRLKKRTVVPVGGGKDSIVTIETLKAAGIEPVLFSVGNPRPIRDTIAVSGLPSITVKRTLSPLLTEMNAAGVLNGHVPVTGIIAFILALAAVLYDFSDVAMSNERSANVGNTILNGRTVNHQWSKSVEFEKAFTALMQNVLPDFRYFSFLRPLSEAGIAKRFAAIRKYDAVFTSCNRAFRLDATKRLDRWCGECDKCRFVFLILAPFMEKERLVNIFGRNPLNEPEQTCGYEELLGLAAFKPFECVGEIKESVWAFLNLCSRPEWKDDAIVKKLKDSVLTNYKKSANSLKDEIFSFSGDHFIPKGYEDALGRLEKQLESDGLGLR